MSVRTFTRRFREETGTVGHAAGWCSSASPWPGSCWRPPTRPVERVAADAGFGTAASLRQHLHAAIGVAPLTYRRTLPGPGRSPDVTGHSPLRANTNAAGSG